MKRTFFLLVILLVSPVCMAGDWYVLSGQTKKIEFNTQLVENELWNYLSKKAEKQFAAREQYAYQYSFVGNEDVLIHGLCHYHPKGMETDFIDTHIMDGGACYFSIKYNSRTKKFSELSTHGEA